MKKLIWLGLLAALAACSAPAQPVSNSPLDAIVAEEAAPSSQPASTLPALEAVYQDGLNRFALHYPAAWHLLGGEQGSRGGYLQIASWDPGAAGIESVPEGESLLQIAGYLWDPKGDLPARVAMRRGALTSSGNAILEESELSFAGGPAAVRMLLQDTSGGQSLLYFFVLGDDYLEITGVGDLAVIDQIISTFNYLSQ